MIVFPPDTKVCSMHFSTFQLPMKHGWFDSVETVNRHHFSIELDPRCRITLASYKLSQVTL